MIKAILGLLGAVLALPLLLVVLITSPQTVGTKQAAMGVCIGMLGTPPSPDSTIAGLSGPAADLVAQQRYQSTPAPIGAPAYLFVTTLNAVSNWRQLPITELASWLADPQASALPAGALLEQPWQEPEFTSEQYAGLQKASVYERACAVMLRRIDTYASVAGTATATTTRPPLEPVLPTSTLTPSPNQNALVQVVTNKLGSPMTDGELWQLISPAPELDAKRMAFEQIAANPGPVIHAKPGDLACYDFTTSGPAHCSLIVTASATSEIAVIGADGKLTMQPIPFNSTIIRPITTPRGQSQ